LADIARRIAQGFYDTPIKVTSKDELGELASAFLIMQKAIGEREQQVLYQSVHDPLTGLPNRIGMLPALESALNAGSLKKNSIYLLEIDIKNFTQINDELSQEIGDGVLVKVGEFLEKIFTQGKVFRLGSDEFLGILTDCDRAHALRIASDIHGGGKTPILVSNIQVAIEVNIGLAAYPEDAVSSESLLRRVNLALNAGRFSDKNTCFYQDGWDEKHLRRLHLFREFEPSLAAGHISLNYQPKINLEQPEILAAEALVRWRHPDMGFIAPDEFIAIIESSGQITILTRWVLREAIQTLSQWFLQGMQLKLSINLSALDLLVDDLPEYLAQLLQEYSVPATAVCLEITESAIMREAERSLNNLLRLEALGLSLSIDDFGTGYSSLSQLKKLPVSELKIDKSFILNLDTSADDQLIVRSTIELGHTMGLSVTAEGVETTAVKLLLKDYGCDLAQGYLYSKPLAKADFHTWVNNYLADLQREHKS
jgi:diguanylate cyclase (GGDEF)-like protein